MKNDKALVHIALFAAFIAALGLVPLISIPFLGGVPITAQTLGVMLAGVMLGAKRGALSVLLFLLLVAAGLPLLAGGRGGLGVFAGPSVGFLIGWPLGAYACGALMSRLRNRSVLLSAAISAAAGGIGVVYLFGIPGLVLVGNIPVDKAMLGSLVYIPGDLIKVALTAVVTETISRGLPSALTSRG